MDDEIIAFNLGLKMWFTRPITQNGTLQKNKSIINKHGKSPRSLFGQGDILLLRSLLDTQNLTQSAKDLGYSYKYAWQKLQNLSKKTQRKVVDSSRGGYKGGGKMVITAWGKYLIKIFDFCNSRMSEFNEELNQYLVDHPYSP